MKLTKYLTISEDTDYIESDKSIRKNSEFNGENAWTLIFAIFIASIGLNMNSTAVIIGAMLISPLMGPIVAIGYSLSVYDFELLKSSLRNLLIAISISLITSALYFIISPINEAQSELLSRTSPTFYDVLIALFGGAAGIVSSTRTEKGNAIPGVAIATALMPPLCTAGFAIATLNFSYLFGALYLFIINSIFISISTYIFTRYLKFQKVKVSDTKLQKSIDQKILILAFLVIIPSFYTAWSLLNKSKFLNSADKFIQEEFPYKGAYVVDKTIEYNRKNPNISVTVFGDVLSQEDIKELESKVQIYGIDSKSLKIHQLSIYEKLEKKLLTDQQKESSALQKTSMLELQLKKFTDYESNSKQITSELKQLFNNLDFVSLSEGGVSIRWLKSPNQNQLKQVDNFLKSRIQNKEINLVHSIKIK